MDDSDSLIDGLEVNLRKNLKAQRELLGLTQAELAQRATEMGLKGFHQTTVARIEKGDRPLRAVEAIALARVLQISVEFLVEGANAAFMRSLGLTIDEKAREISRGIESLTHSRLELARALDAVDRGENVHGAGELQEAIEPMLLFMLQASLRASSPVNRTLFSYMKYVREKKVALDGTYPEGVGEEEAGIYAEILHTLRAHPDLGKHFMGDDVEYPETP